MAARCGRRWGKTDFGKAVGGNEALVAHAPVGWFAPDYKKLSEAYHEMSLLLEPVMVSSSRMDGVMRIEGGGRIDWWTLEDENAGRSRKYKLVIIDEGAYTKDNMLDIWERSIKPTLLDYGGSALVLSNTNGIDPRNFLYALCSQEQYGFKEFHAPTHDNPHLPREEVAKLERENHPLVYQQEYLAEFVDWSGAAFFAKDKLLENGAGVPYPSNCDAVFATVDTANKTGQAHDGTGVIYWAATLRGAKVPLVVLDWEINQIEGALLETWLPTVNQNLEELAKKCRARRGSLGAFIEDKASGTILIQQARRRKINAHAIDSKLTALGKDERAISVSGYVYQGKVKLSELAHTKVTTYKGTTRNHLEGQVFGFRVGDKDAARRADDLLDDFCYGISLALGNAEGF